MKTVSGFVVFEAVASVKYNALKQWIAQGVNRKYAVKRLKDKSMIGEGSEDKLKSNCKAFAGKAYDMSFEWTDEKMYCSELVWKIY